jgi:hypothetical protein
MLIDCIGSYLTFSSVSRDTSPTGSAAILASAWQSVPMFSMGIPLLHSIGLSYHLFEKAALVQQQLDDTLVEMRADLQELKAGVDFGSAQRLGSPLGMRNGISPGTWAQLRYPQSDRHRRRREAR